MTFLLFQQLMLKLSACLIVSEMCVIIIMANYYLKLFILLWFRYVLINLILKKSMSKLQKMQKLRKIRKKELFKLQTKKLAGYLATLVLVFK